MSSDLHSRLTAGPFWGLVRPVMVPGEEPLHYAHLRSVRGTEEVQGTLFLTTEQLAWRTIDPRKPAGDGLEVPLSDVLAVDRPARFASFHAFRIEIRNRHTGRSFDTYFFPRERHDADRHLCTEMYEVVEFAWQQYRIMRASA